MLDLCHSLSVQAHNLWLSHLSTYRLCPAALWAVTCSTGISECYNIHSFMQNWISHTFHYCKSVSQRWTWSGWTVCHFNLYLQSWSCADHSQFIQCRWTRGACSCECNKDTTFQKEAPTSSRSVVPLVRFCYWSLSCFLVLPKSAIVHQHSKQNKLHIQCMRNAAKKILWELTLGAHF